MVENRDAANRDAANRDGSTQEQFQPKHSTGFGGWELPQSWSLLLGLDFSDQQMMQHCRVWGFFLFRFGLQSVLCFALSVLPARMFILELAHWIPLWQHLWLGVRTEPRIHLPHAQVSLRSWLLKVHRKTEERLWGVSTARIPPSPAHSVIPSLYLSCSWQWIQADPPPRAAPTQNWAEFLPLQLFGHPHAKQAEQRNINTQFAIFILLLEPGGVSWYHLLCKWLLNTNHLYKVLCQTPLANFLNFLCQPFL